MADNSKAHLSEALCERIVEDQWGVDKRIWPEIAAMQVPQITILTASLVLGSPTPPRPKLRIKLFEILARYAIELFDCEYRQYPDTEKIQWGSNLIQKTVTLVMKKISQIEAGPMAGLEYHAPYGEMQGAVRTALNAHFLSIPKPILPLVFLPLPSAETKLLAQAQPNEHTKSIGQRLDEAALGACRR